MPVQVYLESLANSNDDQIAVGLRLVLAVVVAVVVHCQVGMCMRAFSTAIVLAYSRRA